MEHKRNCPKCGKLVYHTTDHILKQSIKQNRLCKKCSNALTNEKKKGIPLSKAFRRKISICKTGVKHSESHRLNESKSQKKRYENSSERVKTSILVKNAMHRQDVRKKHITALSETKFLGKPVDRGQVDMLNKWNRLGFDFQVNYQIKTDLDLFYIDGYDKEKNVVMEYDSKYHFYRGQQEKDLIRQNKIIDILKPRKFWRYNAVDKLFNNVLESVG